MHRMLSGILVLASLLVSASSLGNAVAAGAAAQDHDPTHGFYVFPPGDGTWVSVPLGEDFTEIERLRALPPGNYIANASAVLALDRPELIAVDCVFMLDGNHQGELARGQMGPDTTFLTLPLTVGFTLRTTHDLVLACRGGPGVVSQGSPITAIRVNRLTVR